MGWANWRVVSMLVSGDTLDPLRMKIEKGKPTRNTQRTTPGETDMQARG